jgi:hypothetical protein
MRKKSEIGGSPNRRQHAFDTLSTRTYNRKEGACASSH